MKSGFFRITNFMLVLLALALTIGPAGCSQASPSIKIIGPSGPIFAIGDVTLSVDVSNFKIVDKQGQANVKGEGHLHYFMDVAAPTAQGKPAVTEPGTYAHVTDTSYTWHNIGGGSHTFSVELVNNDHTPLNPPVVASVTLLVVPEIGQPGAVILTPRDGGIVLAGDVSVTVQVDNFDLVNPGGQPNAARQGHLNYFLDFAAPTTAGQPAVGPSGTYISTADTSYTWHSILPGQHTLSIELVNNDQTPLDTPVVATVMVNVQ